MIRKKFIPGTLAFYPLNLLTKIKTRILSGSGKGVKVSAGEARFGVHHKMKGVQGII